MNSTSLAVSPGLGFQMAFPGDTPAVEDTELLREKTLSREDLNQVVEVFEILRRWRDERQER